jgi:hydrogenase maturation protease
VTWRIIGCGTTFRGDDEAGLLVARQLRTWGLNANEHDRDSLDLIESWQAGECIILIDAIYSGAPPGTIVTLDGCRPAAITDECRCSTHTIAVAQALELARVLGRVPPRLILYGIEGRRFEIGSTPSPEVAVACRQLANRIVTLVRPGRLRRAFAWSRAR